MSDGTDGPMTARVRRIGVRSVFLLFLLVYGVVGLVTGSGLAVLSTLEIGPEAATTFLDELGWWAAGIGFVAYGLVGGIAASVAAIIYNMAAAVTGGVKVKLNVAHEVDVVPHHRRERVETTHGGEGRESTGQAGGGKGDVGDGRDDVEAGTREA